MPVQDEYKRFSRAERRRRLERRLEALLEEAKSENDQAAAVNLVMKEKEELMRFVIASLEGYPSVESK